MENMDKTLHPLLKELLPSLSTSCTYNSMDFNEDVIEIVVDGEHWGILKDDYETLMIINEKLNILSSLTD